ncbi:transposase [Candidatus Synechococcus calcipolaris G9]|uniref:Transposase n=1 Tax=Candidatus Synechococcus calcipolaris G9 TaxID=1497997 RepID=A0ABT6F2B1_9SYNE|nr:transposase [Candidatus Synechococcus calcipolaris]MDG2991973.1 transposase [Candidatus Synechococcus calcipolaris G9]
MKEKVEMSQKPRRTYTAEQKADAVAIVQQSGKPISQVAQEMGLTESALRKWVKQAIIHVLLRMEEDFPHQYLVSLRGINRQ